MLARQAAQACRSKVGLAGNRLLEQESFTDLDKDDKVVAPQRSPDEEHLDVPSTGATKLHQECEDPDESGSEYSDERSDEELEEASADVVGGPDEEAEKVDQKVDSEASADVVGGPDEEAEKVETVDTNGSTGPVIRREVPLSCQSLLTDPFEVPVKRQSPPSSILVRDATKPRPKKTLRFSEHVDHRSISPRPRSASAPENSGTADKLRGKTMAAQGTARSSASKASTAAKPVPVQSSSFSEFLFLPPVPENKTEPPPQSLSNFLFAPNDSTAQHAVPAVEMESSRRSGEEHHPGSAHHQSSDAHHHSSDAHRSGEAHHRGSQSQHRSNDTHHRSSESHHRSSDAHHRSSDAHHGHGKGPARKRKHDDKHDKGIQQTSSTTASTSTSSSSSSAGEPASLASRGEVSGTMVHHSSSFQVTEEMAREAYKRGLGCSLERRVLERAYFLFQNGQSEDADANYFTALRIELSESG